MIPFMSNFIQIQWPKWLFHLWQAIHSIEMIPIALPISTENYEQISNPLVLWTHARNVHYKQIEALQTKSSSSLFPMSRKWIRNSDVVTEVKKKNKFKFHLNRHKFSFGRKCIWLFLQMLIVWTSQSLWCDWWLNIVCKKPIFTMIDDFKWQQTILQVKNAHVALQLHKHTNHSRITTYVHTMDPQENFPGHLNRYQAIEQPIASAEQIEKIICLRVCVCVFASERKREKKR